MVYQSNIEKRIKDLEQKTDPASSRNLPVCFIRSGQDKDEVLAKYHLDNDVKAGERVHVVRFISPELPPEKQ